MTSLTSLLSLTYLRQSWSCQSQWLKHWKVVMPLMEYLQVITSLLLTFLFIHLVMTKDHLMLYSLGSKMLFSTLMKESMTLAYIIYLISLFPRWLHLISNGSRIKMKLISFLLEFYKWLMIRKFLGFLIMSFVLSYWIRMFLHLIIFQNLSR